MNSELWIRAGLLMRHRTQARVVGELSQRPLRQEYWPQDASEAKEALTSRGLQPWSPQDAGHLPVLIVQGQAPTRPAVAVVGSRASDEYGLACARKVARDAVKLGFSVISGGAEGCDASAHEAALDAGGETVVVLGSGHEHLYPRRHRALFLQVVAGAGAIISPYWPDTRPAPHRFLARNRVIAALAEVTVVVRARAKSGALSTAKHAQACGKKVLAVPSDVDEGLGQGCNELLARGAYPMRGLEDLARALEVSAVGRWALRHKGRPDPWAGEDRFPRGEHAAVPDEHRVRHILAVLNVEPHVDFEMLVERTGLPVESVSSIILQLEVSGRVRRVGGQRFASVTTFVGE